MSTPQLTPTAYVVLGLLELLGPATSYDLKQAVAASVGNFWSFPHSQLYAEPARLVEAGLVTAEREERGRRRRTYTITDAGRRALRDWLAEPETAELEIRDPGLLKLFFADAGRPEDVAALADAQRARHAERLAHYRALDAAAQAGDEPERGFGGRATLRFGLAVEEAYVRFWSQLADTTATD